MNNRQLYGRAGRDGKEDKIRAVFNNNKRIEEELDAEVRTYLESNDMDVINPNDMSSDYNLAKENNYKNQKINT